MAAARSERAGRTESGLDCSEREQQMRSIVRRVALPIGAAVVLGSGGFAFMAVNGVPGTHVGSGEADISGYNVSNVHYTYADVDDNPELSYIKTVAFTLDHAASQVSAHIKAGPDLQPWVPYDNCVNTSGSMWTCSASSGHNAALAYHNGAPDASILHVSAAQ
jgi:hypothetical protein